MILRPVRPGIAHRAADHELPRRVAVDEVAIVLEAPRVVEILREDRLDHVLDQIRLEQRVAVEAVAMLGGDEHALDLDRPLAAVLVELVADRHLRLPVGAQVREDVGLPHLREPLREPVREHDRQRHQLVGLVRGVAEHHSLVACSLPVQRVVVAVLALVRVVHTLGDVRRLLVDRDDDAGRVRVEAELGARVADLADPVADEARDVDVRLGRDLARDDDEPGRDQRLAGDTSLGIVGEDGVEHGVGDLVGHLVRMALGDRLRGEGERATGHAPEASGRSHQSRLTPRSVRGPSARRRAPSGSRRRGPRRRLR